MTVSHGIPILLGSDQRPKSVTGNIKSGYREFQKEFKVKARHIRSFWVLLTTGLGLYAIVSAIRRSEKSKNKPEVLFVVQHVRYSIKPGKLDAYLPLLAELETESRKVSGVLSFRHYHDRQDANTIFLEAKFDTKETARLVFDSPARAKYLAAAADLWSGMSQFSWYSVAKERDLLAEM